MDKIQDLGLRDGTKEAKGTEFCPQYELTRKGEPICINEHAIGIADRGEHVQVIQLDDWNKKEIFEINPDIKLNTDFINEIKPERLCK